MDNVTAPSSTDVHGEEQHHHEKKPVLKKVKDKVKKIKNAIGKKSHGHGDEGQDVDHHQHGDLDEGDEGFVEDDDMMEEPEVHGAPMYESSAIGVRTGGKDFSGGRGEGAERAGDGLGSIKPKFVEDPVSPPNSEAETKTGAEHSRGGEEADVPPELRRSLEAMTVSSHNDGQEKEAIKGANNTYTGMVTSAASKVYELVADAGTAVISKVKPDGRKEGEGEAVGNQDKGLSVKDYITEKLTPGEDEKALSELITEAGQLKKSEEVEVPRQVGTGFDEGGRGAGVVDRLKETVTSLLGGGQGSPKLPATEPGKKVADSEDSLR
ncbi:low-temperature-induced 65 kDa protein-like [Phalaenopsis equestris]|uniref:low-temperature-induced 65 kDa protein-like n=1 Tax=Phalaenopsis equestris TaxID=78828 RepID=UPI0009E654E5|nr:low-temperature-induced 65 kDa protein-like [Phalaenopsis equestris]